MKILTTILALAAVRLAAAAQPPIYLDPSQPFDKRVDDLIPRLKLEEKTSLLSTTAPAIERLKIPVMNGWNQSLHGIVWTKPTTMFPVNISMAATWDVPLIHDVAAAIADEGRAIFNYWPTVQGKTEPGQQGQAVTVTARGEKLRHNGLVYRSPVLNISRDPRWGRIHEAFGEDPYLAARMTVAYVRGTQGDDAKYLKLAATLKHYAVNNQESDRSSLSARVSDRMLMEYFLPHFKAGIMEGHATSIMSSYNAINGTPNAENKLLLTDILRDQWGFDGFVVPDSGAVERLVNAHKRYATIEEAAARTILAGSDLDNGAYARVLPAALAKGFLTEKDIDQALRRVLMIRFRLGEFDPPEMVPYSKISAAAIDSAPHREMALRTARESIVLLTNKNNLLPLDKSKIKTIAVIGPHANREMTGIGYTGLASKFVKPIDGITNKVAPGTHVLYARGSGILESDDPEASYAEAVAVAKKADVAVLFLGTDQLLEGEGRDRMQINLPPIQQQLVRRVSAANPKTVVVLLNGGPVSLGGPAGGGGVFGRPLDVPAVVEMFFAGEEGGTAIADVLFGDYNPGGKLPYTVYGSVAELPPMDEYDITKGFTYMYFDGKPEYPFGHGLSYTTFQYTNLDISPQQISGSGQETVHITVENTGKRAGDEVVQLYVHDDHASVKRAKKELRAFERIRLQPREKRTVTFTRPARQLAFYDEHKKEFSVEPGGFDVFAGSSSEDIRGVGRFQVTTPGQWSK
jgi:beta-glucosidase